MRSVVVLLVVVAALVAGPALVSAQGLLGLPSLFGKGDDCDPMASFSIYTGYASDGGMTKYGYSLNQVMGALLERRFAYDPTHALYLGVAVPVPLGGFGAFRLAGSLTLPAKWEVDDIINTTTIGPNEYYRAWTGDTIWGTVEGLVEYSVGSGFSALGGFRWDHWQTSLTNPRTLSLNWPAPLPTYTGALTVNGYIPLVGGKTSFPGFTFGVVGFPFLFGDIEFNYVEATTVVFNETMTYSKGYFVEFFTEYDLPGHSLIAGFDGSLSVFAKYSAMEATCTFSLTRLPDGFEAPGDFFFRRHLFVVGGKASVSFNIPNVWDSL